jgi:phosphopantetheine--protein transferase-like protein
MIKGIGIDIADTNRFITVPDRKQFIKQIFNEKEIKAAQFLKRNNFYLAARFVMKEAILKAYRIGLHFGSFWHHIHILKNHRVTISGTNRTLFGDSTKVLTSHACSKRYAVSVALVHE